MNKISKEIIEKSLIILDTSALIELYYFPDEVLSIIEESLLKSLPHQFWIPNQVAIEYEEKRKEKKNVPSNSYNSLVTNSGDNGYIYQIESGLDKLQTTFKTLSEYSGKMDKHPYLKEELLEGLSSALESGIKIIQESITPIKVIINDKIREYDAKDDKVKQLIEDYLIHSRKYSFSEKFAIAEEGERRFSLKIPPGWADGEGKNAKEGIRKYSDLIIWKQICEISKEQESDIIFITKDYAKDDWCCRTGKSSYIDTPKTELIDELDEISGKKLRMFSLIQFLTYSSEELDFDLDPSKLEVSNSDESFIMKEINTENRTHNCWGVSQKLEGDVYISNKEIRVNVKRLILTNENGIDWFIPTITVNIAYTNESRRWDILKPGDPHKIDIQLTDKGDSVNLENFDLIVNRESIDDLNKLWLVFQIDTYNDGRKSYGTMYNHWKELT